MKSHLFELDPPDRELPREVFIFRIGQFGDTVVALPAIHRIAQMHPGARLTLITNAPSRESFVTAWDVVKHTGLFSEVVSYSPRDMNALLELALRCRGAKGAWLYYLSPRRSYVQILRDVFFFRALCGFRKIVGLDRAPQPSMRDWRGHLRVLPREWERLLHLVDPGAESPRAPFLKPHAAATERVDALIQGFPGKRLIALGPGSKMPAKKWFADRFTDVGRRLLRDFPDAAIVVFGGAEDREQGEALVRALGSERVLNLAGVTDIAESAAALARCSLYVGNDTGTMHLAAVMGVPCVAIFTSRDNRDVWVPWGEAHRILRHDIACSGCMLTVCDQQKMRCLDLISVEDVVSASRRSLEPLGGSTAVLR